MIVPTISKTIAITKHMTNKSPAGMRFFLLARREISSCTLDSHFWGTRIFSDEEPGLS